MLEVGGVGSLEGRGPWSSLRFPSPGKNGERRPFPSLGTCRRPRSIEALPDVESVLGHTVLMAQHGDRLAAKGSLLQDSCDLPVGESALLHFRVSVIGGDSPHSNPTDPRGTSIDCQQNLLLLVCVTTSLQFSSKYLSPEPPIVHRI